MPSKIDKIKRQAAKSSTRKAQEEEVEVLERVKTEYLGAYNGVIVFYDSDK